MNADRVRHDARADDIEDDLLQCDREREDPEEDVRCPKECHHEHRYLGDDRSKERNDHREPGEHRKHAGERNAERDKDRERSHAVDESEQQRPADEPAE